MDDKIYSRHSFRMPKILQKNFNPKKKANIEMTIKIFVVLIIAITFAHFSLKAIEPIMEENCRGMAKAIATKISNIKATEIMKKYEYSDILNITKDEQGNIKMVETNIFTVNKIISDIPVYIQEELDKSENNSFNIPLGSFLGSKMFSGIGPKVKIRMQTIGDLETDLKSELISAGINQTLHRIYLELKCKVVILTPFKTINEEITNQVLLAEGVIIGEIPNSYYNLQGIKTDNAIDIIE